MAFAMPKVHIMLVCRNSIIQGRINHNNLLPLLRISSARYGKARTLFLGSKLLLGEFFGRPSLQVLELGVFRNILVKLVAGVDYMKIRCTCSLLVHWPKLPGSWNHGSYAQTSLFKTASR